MSKKRKIPKTGRRKPSRSRKKRVLLVCGGKVTEHEYFDFAKAELNASAVKVVSHREGKDPMGLVKYAEKLKKQASRNLDDAYDEVWAITDTDQFTNLSAAQKFANENEIRLSITNPCFEVWLIDHLRECPVSCYSTMACEKKAVELGLVTRGKGDGKNVKKAKHIISEQLAGKMDVAIKNARRHNAPGKKDVRDNNANNVAGYAVWTDVPAILSSISDGCE